MTNELPIKRGGNQHKFLSTLSSRGALTTQELRALVTPSWTVSKTRDHLFEMVRMQLLSQVAFEAWTVTNEGLNLSVTMGRPDSMPASKPRRERYHHMQDLYSRENYSPTELGLNCVRPGAYDALHLPSRINDRLHYRSGMVVDFKGQAGEAGSKT